MGKWGGTFFNHITDYRIVLPDKRKDLDFPTHLRIMDMVLSPEFAYYSRKFVSCIFSDS